MADIKNFYESQSYQTSELFEDNDYKNQIVKIFDLVREKEPLVSRVTLDESLNKLNSCFDYDFEGENKFYPFKLPEFIKNLNFQILVITGASGSGKSTFSKYFGQVENITWDNSNAIISNFEDADDAVRKLGAVGLNSIPTWCKPRHV